MRPIAFLGWSCRIRFKLLLTVLLAAVALSPLRPAAAEDPARLLTGRAGANDGLPDGERWLKHLREGLIPFYTTGEATGSPVGNFPTFRCNNGSVLNPEQPCPEFAGVGTTDWQWLTEGIHRDYVRIKSRQIFFYCAAYHMTGDEGMLTLAKAGVDYLRANYFDADKLPYSYRETRDKTKTLGPARLERTSQDLAYALNGLAFYYYLTRDPDVQADLLRVKNHIFDEYYDPGSDLIRWVARDLPNTPSRWSQTKRMELVAQLDQINGYMLLTTPAIPEPERTRWTRDMVQLSHVMIRRFYSPANNLFWGSVHDDAGPRLGSPHTDYGHTVKTLWMIERVGRLAANTELIDFAVPKVPRVLDAAYLADERTWASKPDRNGQPLRDKEWWIHAELDQAAATWSLADPSFERYLRFSYRFWFDKFVDHQHHEVWHLLKADGTREYPKAHLWKNGFHTSEHALIGYITAQASYGRPAILYFAPKADAPDPTFYPYLFHGTELTRERRSDPFKTLAELRKVQVRFVDIR